MTDTVRRPFILVPVDFSEHSEQALLKASEFSDGMGFPLLILHVIHDPAEMPGYYSAGAKKSQLADLEDLAAEMFTDFLKKLQKKYADNNPLKSAETLLLTGIPVTRILQVVEKYKPEMVIMGSQGHTGLKHIWLGSKAVQIVQLCPVPVTIVKQAVNESNH